MKKQVALLFLLTFHAFYHHASAQAFFDKGPLISMYVGTDWYKALYRASYPDTLNTDGQRFLIHNLSSSGSWGGKLEQFVTRRFGVSLDFWYAQTNVSGICFQLIENQPYLDPYTGGEVAPSSPYREEFAYFNKRLSRLNATLRFDLHVGRSSKVDPYFHAALGGAFYKLYFTSSNPDVYNEDRFYFPISLKIGSGIRFFVSDHVGLFAELSIGGPIIVGGLSYKFHKKEEEKW